MSISDNLLYLKNQIPPEVKLIAVSKFRSAEVIMDAYHAGQRVFGENKVKELVSKQPLLPKDMEWHFIGHLQSNKVRYIAPFIHLIHSVDSLGLLQEINKEAVRHHRIIDVLFQFHIAKEESKFGMKMDQCRSLLESDEFPSLQNVRVIGVMGMATFTSDEQIIRSEFNMLRNYFHELKSGHFLNCADFHEISMGMSGDYMIAIEQGSTMVRIGSAFFEDS